MNDNNNTESVLYAVGTRGYSAYEVAVQNGFVGTEQEWLDSLVGPEGPQGQPFDELTPEQKAEITGPDGKSAYDIAVEHGFEGTEEDFVDSYLNADKYYNKTEINGKVDALEEDINDNKNKLDLEITNRTVQCNNLQSQIAGLGSGSPIPAADVTEMTDTSKLYVNTTDGYVYYYDSDNTQWAQGWVYQATEDAETIDVRQSVNNIIYKTAGDGTRAITGMLYDIISNYLIKESPYLNTNLVSMVLGSKFNFSTGGYNSTTNEYARTIRIENSFENFIIVPKEDYQIRIPFYNNNTDTFVNSFAGFESGFYTNNPIIITKDIKYFAIQVYKEGAELTSTDIYDYVNFYVYDTKILDYTNTKVNMKEIKLNPNDLFEANTSVNIGSGLSYNIKCFRHGYMNTSSSGTTDSATGNGRTQFRLDNFFGNVPKGIKVKLLDTSELQYPLIRIGFTDSTQNIVLGSVSYTSNELYVDIPSYPNRPEADGYLMITVGRFNDSIPFDADHISDLEDRYVRWFDENVEVYWYFEEALPDRDYSIAGSNYLSSNSNRFIYNETYDSAIKLPDNYHPYTQEKTPMIILSHGLSSTITSEKWGSSDDMMSHLVRKFVQQGFAVMDVNQVTTVDWCNPALIKKYCDAINYYVNHYNVEPKYLYGESMGCMIGLTLQEQYNIKAMVFGGTRLDFEYSYNRASDAAKAIMDSNLGFTNGFDRYIANGWCKTITTIKDQDNNDVNPHKFPPTLYMIGTEDTQTDIATAKVQAIRRGGNIAELKEYNADHHNICYLISGTSFNDCIEWFNKWK